MTKGEVRCKERVRQREIKKEEDINSSRNESEGKGGRQPR